MRPKMTLREKLLEGLPADQLEIPAEPDEEEEVGEEAEEAEMEVPDEEETPVPDEQEASKQKFELPLGGRFGGVAGLR